MTDEEFEQKVEAIRRKHSAIVPATLQFEVEAGWLSLIEDAVDAMVRFLEAWGWAEVVRIRQIKQKLGGLRIYARPDHDVDWPDAVAEGLISIRYEFEARSRKICEICSEPGEVREVRFYLQCLCEHHAQRRSEWAAAGWPDVDWR